jgi:hypothetical protein
MSLRAAYLSACAVLFTVSLSGCPSRPDGDITPPTMAARQQGASDTGAADGSAQHPDAARLDSSGSSDAGDASVMLDADASAAAPEGGDVTVDADDNGVPEQPKLAPTFSALGRACQVGDECASGSCVDGVCCSTASCGACFSCAVTGSLGTCAPLQACR